MLVLVCFAKFPCVFMVLPTMVGCAYAYQRHWCFIQGGSVLPLQQNVSFRDIHSVGEPSSVPG
jgi:hypothetical protein